MSVRRLIFARCPVCGPIELAPSRVTLVAYDTVSPSMSVAACPRCGEAQSRPVDSHVLRGLRGAGVRTVRVTVERRSGPPISLDDLIDLGLQMEAL